MASKKRLQSEEYDSACKQFQKDELWEQLFSVLGKKRARKCKTERDALRMLELEVPLIALPPLAPETDSLQSLSDAIEDVRRGFEVYRRFRSFAGLRSSAWHEEESGEALKWLKKRAKAIHRAMPGTERPPVSDAANLDELELWCEAAKKDAVAELNGALKLKGEADARLDGQKANERMQKGFLPMGECLQELKIRANKLDTAKKRLTRARENNFAADLFKQDADSKKFLYNTERAREILKDLIGGAF